MTLVVDVASIARFASLNLACELKPFALRLRLCRQLAMERERGKPMPMATWQSYQYHRHTGNQWTDRDSNRLNDHGRVVKGVGHLGLGHDGAMEAGGREFSLHGRVVKGVGHLGLGHDEAMEAGGCEFSLHGRVVKGVGHRGHDEAMEAGGREFSLHGRVVKGVGHRGHDEAMEAGGREFSFRGRVVKGVAVGHLNHDEAMEVGGREFDPRLGHYSRMSF